MEKATTHFVLIPWIGSISHIIPMTDIGRLLASHGAAVTIITTPANAALVQRRVDEDDLTTPPHGATGTITVTAIPFPAADAGLPAEASERLDLLRSPADVPRFFAANKRFGDAVARHCLGDAMPRRPSCVVAGMCHTWALGMARELAVPCYVFHGFGAFALLCIEYLYKHRPHEAAVSSPDDEQFVDIPVLPGFGCKVSRAQLPPHFATSTNMGGGMLQEVRDFDVAADGVVVNTFAELEHGSCALLSAATGGRPVVAVGPVSLCRRRSTPDLAMMTDDARRVMEWLDARETRSVVYVSFGSAGRMPAAQLVQLGMALASCPWHVVWVVKGADAMPDDVNKFLRESFDDDGSDGKCLVVRGWAPQVAVLEHRAVGGFVTHCGWGSTLEAVAAGVPMATWPLFAEQFLNERLIVDVLGVGVSVGVTKPTENVLSAGKLNGGGGGADAEAEVGMERVMKALERLMDEGEEGEQRRKKAQELKAKAKGALQKGGSSYMNLEKLIQSLVS